MRSGPARRCASYCTWSWRSRTIVLESAEDQCRIPVTRGNFDNSCAFAGELLVSLESEVELASPVVEGFAADAFPVAACCAAAPDSRFDIVCGRVVSG